MVTIARFDNNQCPASARGQKRSKGQDLVVRALPGSTPYSTRVLHTCWPTDGGVAGCVLEYAKDQVRRGWRVAVACPPDGWLAREVHRLGAVYVRWEAVREPNSRTPLETRALWRIVHTLRPDIVHLHSSKAGLAGRLGLRGRLPTIFQPHGWSFYATAGVSRSLTVLWERWSARWADAIVCVSRSELNRGRAAGIQASYRVVPNGVDLSTWREAAPEAKRASRTRLGLAETPIVVCVGRLTLQKGQDMLLDAWREVVARAPSARLILVGDGPDESSLRSRSVSGVEFVGFRGNVADWLDAADVVAVPSRWDGMSIALLEAMARGRSIVATDVPGARESLRDETGVVLPVGASHEFAEALLSRLMNPALAATEGRLARRVVEEHHDLSRTLEGLASVYEQVLNSRRHAQTAARPRPSWGL